MNTGLTDQFKANVDLLRRRNESVLDRTDPVGVESTNPSGPEPQITSGQEASMLDRVMLMSEFGIKNSRTAKRSLSVGRANVERMTFFRAGIIGLAALLMTAIWAPILYFGAMFFGAPMELTVLLRILGVMFFVSIIALSLTVSTEQNSDPEDPS